MADAERQATHSAECWRWHLGCAVARAERLERELAIVCDEDQRKMLEIERLRDAIASTRATVAAWADGPTYSGDLARVARMLDDVLAPAAGEAAGDGDR